MTQPNFKFDGSKEQGITNQLFQSARNVIVYRGVTTDNTPTEIFIDGVTGCRLVPPANCIILADYKAIAQYNLTSGDTTHHISRGSFSLRRQGTTCVANGTNAGILGGLTATAINSIHTGNPVNTVVVGTASHLAFTIDDTNDRVVLTVTGHASNETHWEVLVEPFCVAMPNLYSNGDQ